MWNRRDLCRKYVTRRRGEGVWKTAILRWRMNYLTLCKGVWNSIFRSDILFACPQPTIYLDLPDHSIPASPLNRVQEQLPHRSGWHGWFLERFTAIQSATISRRREGLVEINVRDGGIRFPNAEILSKSKKVFSLTQISIVQKTQLVTRNLYEKCN